MDICFISSYTTDLYETYVLQISADMRRVQTLMYAWVWSFMEIYRPVSENLTSGWPQKLNTNSVMYFMDTPYLTLSYVALRYLTLRCATLPYRTLRFLTLPYIF